MNRAACFAWCLAALAAAPGFVPVTLAEPRPPVKGEVLVVTRGPSSARTLESLAAGPARSVLVRHGLDSMTPVGPGRAAASRVFRLRSARPDFDPALAAAELRASGAFQAAIPNLRLKLFVTTPDDLYLPYQWYVDNGDSADIELPSAWDIARGDTGTVIAIMDTGVDTGHPDLASQIWTNRGEIPGNSVDDDGNGFVDDVHGWDFGVGDDDPNPQPTIDAASGIDVGFHGTYCAGIAAAATDNGEGIAGAGWRCRIMPLKISDAAGDLTSDAAAGAFLYAIDQHASVLSMSFGAAGDPGVPEFFQALVDMADSAGVMCIAAAGNEGASDPTYPAACDHVLAVGATNALRARSDFSNFGPWVDICAPGEGMWSTLCRNYDADEISQIIYMFLWGWDGVNPYMGGDGTSFACPLVAGVAGLVRARQPYLTPAQVAAHLIATGDPIAFDQPIGPKVNAARAVNPGVLDAPGTPLASLGWSRLAPNPASGATALSFRLPHEGRARVALLDAAGRVVRVLHEGTLPAGETTLRWDGANARGERAAAGVYFAALEFEGRRIARRLVRLAR